jgi:hypothetical protein
MHQRSAQNYLYSPFPNLLCFDPCMMFIITLRSQVLENINNSLISTSQVIFADGTFIDGSTSELSCDGPLREPFAVFCQVC